MQYISQYELDSNETCRKANFLCAIIIKDCVIYCTEVTRLGSAITFSGDNLAYLPALRLLTLSGVWY